MLTDLRAKLDAVGRLDALAAVSQRALQYYGGQDLDRTDADTLGRRARTQMLIGEVDNLRGDLDAALRSYEQAATTREQLERDPDNPQRLFDHAQSEFWVGYIAWQRGDLDQAERHMHAYHDYAQRLVTLEADRAEWRTELGYAFSNLGTLTVERPTGPRPWTGSNNRAGSMKPTLRSIRTTMRRCWPWARTTRTRVKPWLCWAATTKPSPASSGRSIFTTA